MGERQRERIYNIIVFFALDFYDYERNGKNTLRNCLVKKIVLCEILTELGMMEAQMR